MTYHKPVLLESCIQHLTITPDGTYLDATFGGGGHSRLILEHLGPKGRLFAFDQDPDAAANAPDDSRFTLIPYNFEHARRMLRTHGVTELDGILADLGVSSHQLDEGARGFSFRMDGPLDMRMNPQVGQGASDWLRERSPQELAQALRVYGDVPNAMRVAHAILDASYGGNMERTEQLSDVLEPLAKGPRGKKLKTQVFQAIRIAVNRELEVLETLLQDGTDLLKPGGRFVVMSYHSLEDRRVKTFFREGRLDGEAERDDRGRRWEILNRITRKAEMASPDEIAANPRARSVRLRVAEKIEGQWR